MATIEIREGDGAWMPSDVKVFLSRKDAETFAKSIGWPVGAVARWMRRFQNVWVIYANGSVWTTTGFVVRIDNRC